MRAIRSAVAALAAVAIAGSAVTATAQTLEESYPETPATNDALPIIHTYRGSDHLKANVLNPRPVCNSTEDYRTVVYKVKDNFLPVGTISTTNLSDKAIPLSQDLSRTQSISASVNGSKTETITLGGSGSKDGLQGNIGYSLAKSLGWDVSGSLSWSVGQQIGPYEVPAGNTGEATYGFRTVTMTGTQQRCRPNGTWATPTAWIANMPVKNEVRVKNYATPAGSWAPNKGAQVTTRWTTRTRRTTRTSRRSRPARTSMTLTRLRTTRQQTSPTTTSPTRAPTSSTRSKRPTPVRLKRSSIRKRALCASSTCSRTSPRPPGRLPASQAPSRCA
ncbi:hypothetical protein [Corynebacterium sp. HMSC034B08]|uniref:hypothetical protein n=1 Tax=Corynebacterium sp. HMSC034B08 TaxID=1715135 RepID=UPI001FEF3A48|nr:hypothetical protein [Corynebacterium sp. HMSC034B08]